MIKDLIVAIIILIISFDVIFHLLLYNDRKWYDFLPFVSLIRVLIKSRKL